MIGYGSRVILFHRRGAKLADRLQVSFGPLLVIACTPPVVAKP